MGDASGKVEHMTQGDNSELDLHPCMVVEKKGDLSPGFCGDNNDAMFYQLQKHLEAKSQRSSFLKEI